jgi:hypothetical protein
MTDIARIGRTCATDTTKGLAECHTMSGKASGRKKAPKEAKESYDAYMKELNHGRKDND